MRFSSNAMKSPSYGNYNPVPKELIKKMEELAIATKQKKEEQTKLYQQNRHTQFTGTKENENNKEGKKL